MMIEKLQFDIFSFTEYPGPRYRSQGPYSGEALYFDHLNGLFIEAVADDTSLVINLDGTAGYAASFIDEIFGNIIYDFGVDKFNKHIQVISNEEPEWLDVIKDVMAQWQIKREKKLPRKPSE